MQGDSHLICLPKSQSTLDHVSFQHVIHNPHSAQNRDLGKPPLLSPQRQSYSCVSTHTKCHFHCGNFSQLSPTLRKNESLPTLCVCSTLQQFQFSHQVEFTSVCSSSSLEPRVNPQEIRDFIKIKVREFQRLRK